MSPRWRHYYLFGRFARRTLGVDEIKRRGHYNGAQLMAIASSYADRFVDEDLEVIERAMGAWEQEHGAAWPTIRQLARAIDEARG